MAINISRMSADDATYRYFGQKGNGDDDANAFKHAYWNASATLKIGKKMTKLFADAHEFGWYAENINNITAMKMDLYNNQVGREMAGQYSGKSSYSLDRIVMDAVYRGQLIKISNNNLTQTNGGLEWR